MSCVGTLSLSCYHFWNPNGELSDTWIACTPIISIVLVYVAYGLGLGSIPIMLQVKQKQVSTQKDTHAGCSTITYKEIEDLFALIIGLSQSVICTT